MSYPCGDGIFFEKGMWDFNDDNVVKNFNTHIRKQIPGYDKLLNMLKKQFKRARGVRILDLGCSLGETERYILKGNHNNIQIDAVDISYKMIENAYKDSRISYHNMDMVEYIKKNSDKKYDIVLCLYSLQFLEDPNFVLDKIYDMLSDKGIIILADKFGNSSIEQSFLEDYKLSKGYTVDEVIGKRRALYGIQRTLNIDNISCLSKYGNVKLWGSFINFKVYIIRKG